MTEKKEEKKIELLDMLKMMKIENKQILQDKPDSSNRKEIILLLGPKGSGKSTTINCLMGLSLKPNPFTFNNAVFTLVDTPGLGDT